MQTKSVYDFQNGVNQQQNGPINQIQLKVTDHELVGNSQLPNISMIKAIT